MESLIKLFYKEIYKEILCKIFRLQFYKEFPYKLIGSLQQKTLQKNPIEFWSWFILQGIPM